MQILQIAANEIVATASEVDVFDADKETSARSHRRGEGEPRRVGMAQVQVAGGAGAKRVTIGNVAPPGGAPDAIRGRTCLQPGR